MGKIARWFVRMAASRKACRIGPECAREHDDEMEVENGDEASSGGAI